ncbi:neuroglobin-like [Babylonia areolata]|uniref:neuroglobin-like n=1 Tax=Babylonia areolata TaxID=304850 RepID=UPI003FD0461B
MGCTTSSPYKDYYLGLERKKRCQCQCHKLEAVGGLPVQLQGNPPLINAESTFIREDPRIPLTGRQIFLIKRSWKGISRNMCETGINMFLSLFERNEEVLGYFQGLKSVKSLTELRTSKILENHVKGVMLTIDEAITNLDDADTVIDMLMFVGKSHTRFKDFNPNVFMLIKDSFLLAVRDTLGDRYTAHMEDIYQKSIEFILNTLILGFGDTDSTKFSADRQMTNGVKTVAPLSIQTRYETSYSPKPGTSRGE